MFVENGRFGSKFTLLADDSVHYMIAVYSYNPIELSPNIDADVSVFLVFLSQPPKHYSAYNARTCGH